MDHPTADDLARVPLLADRFEVEEFDSGRQLVTEGRAGYSFYLLDRGDGVGDARGPRGPEPQCW